MKRIAAIVALSIIMVLSMSAFAFADTDFSVVETSPKEGATGQSIDNLGVKVQFSEDVYSTENMKANMKKCHLYEIDENGKEIPVPMKVAFNSKDKATMLVVADTSAEAKEKAVIKSMTNYVMRIDKGFLSADGDELGKFEVKFQTLNQKTSATVSVVMMIVMFGGMLFFTIRDSKKKKENEQKAKRGKTADVNRDAVNPYKEAKRTGKTVSEIVERERKKKEKESDKAEKQAKAYAEKQAKKAEAAEKTEKESDKPTIKVVGPRPISAAGSTYVHPFAKNKNKGSGKGNSKNKGKKK